MGTSNFFVPDAFERDAHAEWEQRERQAEERAQKIATREDDYRTRIDLPMLLEAIQEAPAALQQRLYECVQQADWVEVGITIADMRNHLCHVMAKQDVDKDVV